MKKLFLCFLALIPVVMYAQKQTTYTIMESTATFLEPSSVIVTTPLIADIKIMGDKVSYVEPDALKIFPLSDFEQLPQLRSLIVGRAVKKYDADLLVGVSFDMETTDAGELRVTVTGYPAKYTNFRNATFEEVKTIDLAKRATRDDQQVLLNGEKPMVTTKIQK